MDEYEPSDFEVPPAPSRLPGDYYSTLFPLFRLGLNLRYNRIIEGEEHIPEHLPAIYIANHVQAADTPLLMVTIGEVTGVPVRAGAKQEYHLGQGLDNKGKLGRTARWVVTHTGQIPVMREGPHREMVAAFKRQTELTGEAIDRGESVVYHGSGTRVTDGKMYKFRTGVAKQAIEHHALLVPTAISYGEASRCGRTNVRIAFDAPINPDAFRYTPEGAVLSRIALERRITEMAEERVAVMLGAERVDAYAPYGAASA